MSDRRAVLRAEFERAASGFAERTKGRFDSLGVVDFSRAEPADTVLEVGAGTGNFLALFEGAAARLVALDLTPGMLQRARSEHPGMKLVLGDGGSLPFASGSVELVASAQVLHHIDDPAPVLAEMRRVSARRVLVVDQIATDDPTEVAALDELEKLRDPSHAASRPLGALRALLEAAGMAIVDERLYAGEQRLADWMWPGEFPPERIAAVARFIERRGHETGKDFRRKGDDWAFTRRRMMLLCKPA
ncbi:class I SAM-dependent methyltransferase [soil metagenome]